MALAESGAVIKEMVDAGRNKIAVEKAWEIAAEANVVLVASGRSIIEFHPEDTPKEELLAKITGRTGNLRAPTLKMGDKLLVGYNETLYKQLL